MLDNVTLVVNNGSIKVTDVVYGDPSGDGAINGIDLTLIRRFISGGFDITLGQ